MILGFKQLFADRKPTFFEEKILAGIGFMELDGFETPKIHSMRSGKRWRSGMSIQMAYGVRTKNYRQFNKGLEALSTCISTQDVFMTLTDALEITVSGKYLDRTTIDRLIKNDGLTYSEFINWFFPGDNDEWSGQIIQWTHFKY